MSEKRNEGGPAFPMRGQYAAIHGMSLRDWFAGQTLAGMTYMQMIPEDAAPCAAAAYRLADAMLVERERGEG